MNHTVKWLLWLLYATARARPSMRARDGPSYSMMSSLAAEVHFLKIKHTVPMKKPIYFTFSLWWHSTRDNPVKVKATTAASRVRVPPLHKEEFSKASSSNRKSNKKVQVGFLIGCKISFQSFNFGSQQPLLGWAGAGFLRGKCFFSKAPKGISRPKGKLLWGLLPLIKARQNWGRVFFQKSKCTQAYCISSENFIRRSSWTTCFSPVLSSFASLIKVNGVCNFADNRNSLSA